MQEAAAETEFSFFREGDAISLGRAVVGPDWLRVECNSTKRADGLRKRIEDAGGKRLRFKQREQKAMDPAMGEARASARPSSDENLMESADVQEAIQQYKTEYYRKWVDLPVPAIGGLTPRQAAGSARQRANLLALVKDLEMRESQQDHRQRIDLGFLWEELDLKR
jgi:hypothetical protein